MDKQIALLMAAVGALLVVGAAVVTKYPEFSQWWPFLLLIGGGLAWKG